MIFAEDEIEVMNAKSYFLKMNSVYIFSSELFIKIVFELLNLFVPFPLKKKKK